MRFSHPSRAAGYFPHPEPGVPPLANLFRPLGADAALSVHGIGPAERNENRRGPR